MAMEGTGWRSEVKASRALGLLKQGRSAVGRLKSRRGQAPVTRGPGSECGDTMAERLVVCPGHRTRRLTDGLLLVLELAGGFSAGKAPDSPCEAAFAKPSWVIFGVSVYSCSPGSRMSV